MTSLFPRRNISSSFVPYVRLDAFSSVVLVAKLLNLKRTCGFYKIKLQVIFPAASTQLPFMHCKGVSIWTCLLRVSSICDCGYQCRIAITMTSSIATTIHIVQFFWQAKVCVGTYIELKKKRFFLFSS